MQDALAHGVDSWCGVSSKRLRDKLTTLNHRVANKLHLLPTLAPQGLTLFAMYPSLAPSISGLLLLVLVIGGF